MDEILGGGSKLSLRVGLVTLFLAYWIYSYVQKRRDYDVCWPS